MSGKKYIVCGYALSKKAAKYLLPFTKIVDGARRFTLWHEAFYTNAQYLYKIGGMSTINTIQSRMNNSVKHGTLTPDDARSDTTFRVGKKVDNTTQTIKDVNKELLKNNLMLAIIHSDSIHEFEIHNKRLIDLLTRNNQRIYVLIDRSKDISLNSADTMDKVRRIARQKTSLKNIVEGYKDIALTPEAKAALKDIL